MCYFRSAIFLGAIISATWAFRDINRVRAYILIFFNVSRNPCSHKIPLRIGCAPYTGVGLFYQGATGGHASIRCDTTAPHIQNAFTRLTNICIVAAPHLNAHLFYYKWKLPLFLSSKMIDMLICFCFLSLYLMLIYNFNSFLEWLETQTTIFLDLFDLVQ